jgi:hypothetical protein
LHYVALNLWRKPDVDHAHNTLSLFIWEEAHVTMPRTKQTAATSAKVSASRNAA